MLGFAKVVEGDSSLHLKVSNLREQLYWSVKCTLFADYQANSVFLTLLFFDIKQLFPDTIFMIKHANIKVKIVMEAIIMDFTTILQIKLVLGVAIMVLVCFSCILVEKGIEFFKHCRYHH